MDSKHHIAFIFDKDEKPTCIERLFGEQYHVKDDYIRHQISLRFILVLMTVYMVQGGRDCLVIATQYYLPAMFDIDPAELEHFDTIIMLPWTIKIIYGLIIDSIPICGYKRKIYMLSFGILGPITMLIILFFGTKSYKIHLIFLTLNAMSAAFCDVIAGK